MRSRGRWAVIAAALSVTYPLIAAVPAHAATVPGCPKATGDRILDTPATFPRTVALTFDDGPTPTWTPQVLAVLAKHHVHATFFVIGARSAAHPEVLQQIVDAGHVVGNHTWDHPTSGGGMYDLPAQRLATELDPTNALIRDVTGRQVCFFRAPQGKDRTTMIHRMARDRGLTVTAYYTAGDYQQVSRIDTAWVNRIEQRLEGRGLHPILLMHDGGGFRGNTVQALDAIITWYADRGYVFTDPAGRPFPGDLPAGTAVPASGWAVPPDWTAPDDGTAAISSPTDLIISDGADDPVTTGTATPAPTGDGGASGEPAPDDPTTTTTGGGTGAPAPGTRTWNRRRLETLAANAGQDPLAARQLADATVRYLMVFSAPPA